MNHSTPATLRAFPIALALIAGASCWPIAATAQSTAALTAAQPILSPADDTIRLSDEQRMEILNHNTVESAAAARGEHADSRSAGRGIHGEVGVMIGSHGTRGVYGTAEIPLGDNAGATVSFESSRYGYGRQSGER